MINYRAGATAKVSEHLIEIGKFLINIPAEKLVRITVEPAKSNISRQMQKFYFSHLIGEIIQWNIKTGTFTYGDTGQTVVDKDEIDYILREHFFYKKVVIGKKVTKLPKTLKLNKANMKECCDYFDVIIRFFAEKDCFIGNYEFRN
jgi:hypothetical protein